MAILTIILYLAAGAFASGYQDSYGFAYLSLGLEDLVGSSRIMLAPLLLAVASAALIWAIARISPRFRLTLLETILLTLPVLVAIAFAIASVRASDVAVFDPLTFWVMLVYYLVTAFYLVSLRPPRKIERIAGHRWAIQMTQGVVGTLLLILLAYDLGAVVSVRQGQYDFCPRFEKKDWVAVQVTGDMLICAETDIAKRLVYRRFVYAKIGDAKAGDGPADIVLDNRPFTPRCIGVPRDRSDWDPQTQKRCEDEGSPQPVP